MILEYNDIKEHIPQLVSDLKRELLKDLEKNHFISYPEGLQFHLFQVVSDKTYQRVRKLYKQKDFPAIEREGIKGVYLNELKEFLKN